MKKVVSICFLFLFILSGCGKKLTSEDFDDLANGMTSDEIISILGKPNKTIIKQTEVADSLDKEIKAHSKMLAMIDKDEFPETYEKIYDKAIEVAQVKVLLEENNTIKMFIYKYNYTNEEGKKVSAEREIYLYDDEIIAF